MTARYVEAPTSVEVLSADEKKLRKSLETTITTAQQHFVKSGTALISIQEGKLYRSTHSTFEKYCDDRFDMSRSRAYQLIDSAHIMIYLKENGYTVLPKTESQCRPLTGIPAESADLILIIWENVLECGKTAKITAKLITDLVNIELEPATTTEESTEPVQPEGAEPGPEKDTTTPDSEQIIADLRLQLRDAKKRIDHLESALTAEKAAHKRAMESKVGNGVPKTKLTEELIKAGYRRLAASYHPDAGGDEKTMKELNELYQLLIG